MGRLSGPDVEDTVGCNLIPMIDIIFLLLLFFMLSADMSSRELEDLQLAEADQVKEDKNEKGQEGTTTVNVHHISSKTEGITCGTYKSKGTCTDDAHWLITIRSRDFTPQTIGDFLATEAQLELEDAADPATGKRLSKRKVM